MGLESKPSSGEMQLVQHREKNTVIQLNSPIYSWTRSLDVNTESEIFYLAKPF